MKEQRKEMEQKKKIFFWTNRSIRFKEEAEDYIEEK